MKKTIKLSSLSEGLRKQVKMHFKEGKLKMSTLPSKLKKLIESEVFYGNDGTKYDPEKAYKLGDRKAETERNASFHYKVHPTPEYPNGKYTIMKDSDEPTVDVLDNSDNTEEGGIWTFNSKAEALDFIEKRESMRVVKENNVEEKAEGKGLWHNIRAKRARGEKPAPKGSKAHKKAVKAGKEINAANEQMERSTQPIMKNKTIKLSSLSEGLRKEVKKYIKEGKTKLSQMPPKLRRLVEAEYECLNELDLSADPYQDGGGVHATDGDVYRAQRIERILKAVDPTATVEISTLKQSGRPYYKWSGPSPESWPTAIIRGNKERFNDPRSQNIFAKVVALFGSGSFVFPYWAMDDGETLLGPEIYERPDFIGSFQMKNDQITSRNVLNPTGDDFPAPTVTHSTYATPRTIGKKEREALRENKTTIKLSSLSEALRKEVKKHLKEGKTKLSQMPIEIRKSIKDEIFLYENFYQGMNPQQAIQKATIDYSSAIKKGNQGQADKIAGNLKAHLESQNYNWKTDPHALEVLSDFI